ncbi:MAG: hypothetical protein ACK5VI_05520 [Opitutia bacterium]|jgi:hypothetical protein
MPTPPSRARRWLLAALAGGLLAFLLGAGWREVGLRALAEDWRRAHAAGDLAAMEALYCWDGVAPEQRRRLRLALAQELELPVTAVRAARLAPPDQLLGTAQRPNLKPIGVIEVSFAVNDGLGARLLAGRSGLGFRLVVLIPSGS